jgi:hypothetical protein
MSFSLQICFPLITDKRKIFLIFEYIWQLLQQIRRKIYLTFEIEFRFFLIIVFLQKIKVKQDRSTMTMYAPVLVLTNQLMRFYFLSIVFFPDDCKVELRILCWLKYNIKFLTSLLMTKISVWPGTHTLDRSLVSEKKIVILFDLFSSHVRSPLNFIFLKKKSVYISIASNEFYRCCPYQSCCYRETKHYSFMGINRRLNRILYDSMFTRCLA